MTPRDFRRGALATAILSLLQAPASHAQLMLEEVTVTAQKREQSAQDVPVALTAVTADTLQAMGIDTMEDMSRLSPSLTISGGSGKQNSGISIRGIGTSVYSIGVESSVAVIIDDVSQVQTGQALSNLIDIERIEVLRGPQNTLYGKSASAGLISVTTKAPALEFEGSVQAVATSDHELKFTGSASGPLSDTLAYRAMAYGLNREGIYDNLTTGDDINNAENYGARLKLAWAATDALDATLILDYSKDNEDCCALSWRELDEGARFLGAIPEAPAPDIDPSPENTEVRNDSYPSSETRNATASLHLDYAMGEYSLTSITAGNRWQYENTGDLDNSDVDIAGYLTGGVLSGGVATTSDLTTDFVSQEIRLQSPAFERWDYVVGTYYANAQTDRHFDRQILVADWDAEAETESFAIFGQTNWQLGDVTTLSAGLRYNREDISVDFVDNISAVSSGGSDSDEVVVGKLSLQHFVGADTMVYASYARGYKGQAYDISTGFNQQRADNPVKPELSDAYEIGVKTALWDNRVQLNAAAFYTEYDQFQAQNSTIEENEVRVQIANVGQLETQGIELDATALITENFLINAGFAWIDATIKEYPTADCYPGQTLAQGCFEIAPGVSVQDLAGETLNNSPEYKLTMNGEYSVPLTDQPFDGFVNFSYQWQDEVNFDLRVDPHTVQDSYGVLNLSAGIVENTAERYRVTLFVNNVFDKNYTARIQDAAPLYGGALAVLQLVPRNAERYFGVRLDYDF